MNGKEVSFVNLHLAKEKLLSSLSKCCIFTSVK